MCTMDNKNISNSIFTPVARNVVIDPKINEEYINFHDVCKEGELKINQLKAVTELLTEVGSRQAAQDTTMVSTLGGGGDGHRLRFWTISIF